MDGFGRGRQAVLPAWMTKGVGNTGALMPPPSAPFSPPAFRPPPPRAPFVTGANSIAPSPKSNPFEQPPNRNAALKPGRPAPSFLVPEIRSSGGYGSLPVERLPQIHVRTSSPTRLRYRSPTRSRSRGKDRRGRRRSSSSSSSTSSSNRKSSKRRKKRSSSTCSSPSKRHNKPNAATLSLRLTELRSLEKSERLKRDAEYDSIFCKRAFYAEDTHGNRISYEKLKDRIFLNGAAKLRTSRQVNLKASKVRSFTLAFERDEEGDRIIFYECKNALLTSVYMFKDKYRLVSPKNKVSLDDIKKSSVYRRTMKYAVKKGLPEDAENEYKDFGASEVNSSK